MLINKGTQRHPFHMVRPSPWPMFTSIFFMFMPLSFVFYFQGFSKLSILCICIFLYFGLSSITYWFSDIVWEATYEKQHTKIVQTGLKLGFILFLVSEIMFFISFFWAFFHASLAPSIEIGSIWPPKGIEVINPWGLPFYNTCILLYSGVAITLSHNLLVSNLKQYEESLEITIYLGLIFTLCQAKEYIDSSFTISDSAYGSLFFVMTGFHGIHVIIGTIFLIVSLSRAFKNHFIADHHLGFEFAAWYWHFVDVVWLFLFVCLYWWGGN